MGSRSYTIRTRHLVPEKWNVVLVNAAGTRYDLGSVDIASLASIQVPVGVPDGTYNVEVTTDGLAWRGIIQKGLGSLTIDSTASAPGSPIDLPLFTNFSYEMENEWLKLKWDGDVPPELSGVVSAGLWFGDGVPDFDQDPDVTIPLFSNESTHVYYLDRRALYAGLAAIGPSGNQGVGQYIALPDFTVGVPPATVDDG